MAVVARDGQHLGGDVLGQAVLQARAVGVDDLGDASDLGGGGSSGGGVLAGDEHVHVTDAGLGGRDGVEGGALDACVVVICNNECGHGWCPFDVVVMSLR